MFDWTPDWHEYICTSIMNNYAEMIRVFICMHAYGWDDYFKNACMLERTEIIQIMLDNLSMRLNLVDLKQFAIDNGFNQIADTIDKRIRDQDLFKLL
jgi:hypothetical protein